MTLFIEYVDRVIRRTDVFLKRTKKWIEEMNEVAEEAEKKALGIVAGEKQ